MNEKFSRACALLLLSGWGSYLGLVFIALTRYGQDPKGTELHQLLASLFLTFVFAVTLTEKCAARLGNPAGVLFALSLYLPALNSVSRIQGRPLFYLALPLLPLATSSYLGFFLEDKNRDKLLRFLPHAFSGLLLLLHLPYFVPFYEMPSLDYHRASMWIFGGLYKYSSDLLPVRDYFCQYGPVQGFIGKLFLQGSFQNTINWLNGFHAFIRFIFLLACYGVLRRMKIDRSWCLVAVLLLFASQYSANADIGGVAMVFPSVGAYRYAFFPLILYCFWRFASAKQTRSRLFSLLATSIACGLGLAWSSDAGLALVVAVAATLTLGNLYSGRLLEKAQRILVDGALFIAGVTLSYLLALLVVYGPSFFTAGGLSTPFALLVRYANGWSRHDNEFIGNWLYFVINYLAPCWCALTLAKVFREVWKAKRALAAPLLIEGFLALLALATQGKYLTRSYPAYWIYDDFALVLLGVFQIQALLLASNKKLPAPGMNIVRFALVVCAFMPLTDDIDSSYGVGAYLQTSDLLVPRIIHKAFPAAFPLRIKPGKTQSDYFSTSEERQALEAASPPGTPLIVLSPHDFVFYSEVKRPSPFYILPYTDNFVDADWEKRMRAHMAAARVVFVDEGEEEKEKTREMLAGFTRTSKVGRLQRFEK